MSEWASNRSVPSSVQLDDLVPAEERRLRPVPAELRPPVDDGRRNEDRRTEPSLGEERQRLLGDVEEPVVEAESDRARQRPALVEQLGGVDHVDDAVGLGREVVHLSPEVAWADRQLVAVVGDPVVEEDPQALPAPAARPCAATRRSSGLVSLPP